MVRDNINVEASQQNCRNPKLINCLFKKPTMCLADTTFLLFKIVDFKFLFKKLKNWIQ